MGEVYSWLAEREVKMEIKIRKEGHDTVEVWLEKALTFNGVILKSEKNGLTQSEVFIDNGKIKFPGGKGNFENIWKQ